MNDNTMREAIALAQRWPVFRLKSGGKEPATRRGFHDATRDPKEVAVMFAGYSRANIGIVPNPGEVVLDVDPRNDGDVTLERLISGHGRIPDTLTARTGSGGHHIWLAATGKTKGQLCQGVDIKTSSTGYLVAPPSIHPCGGQYAWETIADIAAAPAWVAEKLRIPAPKPLPHREFTGTGGLVRFVTDSCEGERHNRVRWALTKAAQDGALDTIGADIRSAALGMGLGERELDGLVRWAGRIA